MNQPDALRQKKASQVIGLLRANEGFTLIEVLVATLVLVVLITTIYMGVMYADKQIRHNYRHRVATFLASGEIEKQYTLYLKENILRPFSGRPVVIDQTDDSTVKGALSVTVGRDVEYHVTKQYPYYYVIAEVNWTDPETKKPQKVKIREDFYDVEGKVN
ncbi:MAG: prepilin-type N-terminal cleavage/methylation domain-containing protein [Candidatus Cloacimonas sp.]|nr:prepilin-type N-terminal cleavage/methylation domain-containing protein [Candidatus Cloacimonas sp.]